MEAIERPTFPSEASRLVYEYVGRHGTVERHKLREIVPVSADEFGERLDRLKSDGYLEEEG